MYTFYGLLLQLQSMADNKLHLNIHGLFDRLLFVTYENFFINSI